MSGASAGGRGLDNPTAPPWRIALGRTFSYRLVAQFGVVRFVFGRRRRVLLAFGLAAAHGIESHSEDTFQIPERPAALRAVFLDGVYGIQEDGSAIWRWSNCEI